MKIKVLVVDDSLVIRRLVSEALDADERIEVVGIAQNGQIAQRKVAELAPDAVTMDIEMPVMNGIEAVRELRKTHPRLPIVMFSTLTEVGAAATLDALAAGASDYVSKPSNVGSVGESRQALRDELIPKLIALTSARSVQSSRPAPSALHQPARAGRPVPAAPVAPGRQPTAFPTAPQPVSVSPARTAARTSPFEILAVGSSTGGPDALAKLLSGLPADLPVPVVVVQHMPPIFTRMLAERLNSISALTIVEAEAGMILKPGHVLIATGGRHLEVRMRGVQAMAELTDDPPENFCRPAVDVLFRSVAKAYPGRALGVVLTGMGRDGTLGGTRIREARGQVFAQDEATSVVWGMPGALVAARQADKVVPIDEMASAVAGALARPAGGSRPAAVGRTGATR
jgi:two-component system chemotaxis response regulator CheB